MLVGRNRAIVLSILGALLVAPHNAYAVPVTYTIAGNANITFGDSRTGNTPFTIRATGDTADIVQGSAFKALENFVADVQVSGFPPATFTNDYRLLVDHSNSILLFGDSNRVFIPLKHPSFSSYNLAVNHGPVFFPGVIPNASIGQQPTTSGQIIVAEIRNVTFTAAIPEPATIVLIAVTAALLLSCRRRCDMALRRQEGARSATLVRSQHRAERRSPVR
jgi:hypothetical protein